MIQPEIGVVPYRPEFKPQVLDLLRGMWGSDPGRNQSYFEWKYEANPGAVSPLGIVALQQDRVVGFRGYFAVRFEVPGRNDNLLILCPSDMCIHPEYRRRGLSTAMGRLAIREYGGQASGFLSATVNQASLPAGLKVRFVPLVDRVYWTRASLWGVVRHVLARRQVSPIEASRVQLGRQGKILVSRRPRPEEMASVAAGEGPIEGKIGLVRDAAFFRWRFDNPWGKYLFYYRLEDGIAAGYLVLGLSPNNRRGYILDYAPAGGQAIEEIVRHIVESGQVDLLSILSFGVADTLRPVLSRWGFKTTGPVRTLERRLYGELPVLIRPVNEGWTEADWLVEGLDMRKIESWSLKPIVSDDA